MFYKGLKIIKFEGGKTIKTGNIIHFEQGGSCPVSCKESLSALNKRLVLFQLFFYQLVYNFRIGFPFTQLHNFPHKQTQ